MTTPIVFIIIGVSGCGKSTIGKLLATQLNIPFFDGDDYHSEANVEKMSNGNPLNDEDRKGWLQNLNLLAKNHSGHGAVIACSALKQKYRDQLNAELSNMKFVHLEGSKEEILERVQQRKNHFMPSELLDSQFESLERPKDALNVSILDTPMNMVQKIKAHYNL